MVVDALDLSALVHVVLFLVHRLPDVPLGHYVSQLKNPKKENMKKKKESCRDFFNKVKNCYSKNYMHDCTKKKKSLKT